MSDKTAFNPAGLCKTRAGLPVRIVCTDRRDRAFPFIALYEDGSGEGVLCITADGRCAELPEGVDEWPPEGNPNDVVNCTPDDPCNALRRRSSVQEAAPATAPADLTETAASLAEMIDAMDRYQQAVDTDAPADHRAMMERARKALSAAPAAPTAQGQDAAPKAVDVECYWDAEDREYGHAAIGDIMETHGHGVVVEIEHVAVVNRTFHATLPAHGDDDDGWEVEAQTEDEAHAAMDAELARRSSAPSAGEA